MKILASRQGAGLAIVAVLALSLSLQMAGCANDVADDSDPNAIRLVQNSPTNVDLKHDVPVPRNMMLNLQVDFALRDQAAFDKFSHEIDDKKSPNYQHWLTPHEMHVRFGESKEQFDAVEQWLKAEGFVITELGYDRNEDYIKFRGTAEQAEKTFKIHLVEPMYDRYINSKDPAIPPQFVGVISGVEGLYGLLPSPS
jgi:subtilase family serine protease